jgi:hypothetical protein
LLWGTGGIDFAGWREAGGATYKADSKEEQVREAVLKYQQTDDGEVEEWGEVVERDGAEAAFDRGQVWLEDAGVAAVWLGR